MTRYNYEKHKNVDLEGVYFKAKKRGLSVTGKITNAIWGEVNSNNLILCQNMYHGVTPDNKYGYPFGWSTSKRQPNLVGIPLTDFYIDIKTNTKLYKYILNI